MLIKTLYYLDLKTLPIQREMYLFSRRVWDLVNDYQVIQAKQKEPNEDLKFMVYGKKENNDYPHFFFIYFLVWIKYLNLVLTLFTGIIPYWIYPFILLLGFFNNNVPSYSY